MPTLADFRKRISPELAIAYDQEGRAITIAPRMPPREIGDRLETYLDENPADERTASWFAAWMRGRPKAPEQPREPTLPPRQALPPSSLYAKGMSRCHRSRMVLMLSRPGGYVSRNCCTCGKPQTVPLSELPNQSCDGCGSGMTVRYLDGENYFYACDTCGKSWMLASRLAPWYEYFTYSPLPAGPFR
jgi:hypothetical protein